MSLPGAPAETDAMTVPRELSSAKPLAFAVGGCTLDQWTDRPAGGTGGAKLLVKVSPKGGGVKRDCGLRISDCEVKKKM